MSKNTFALWTFGDAHIGTDLKQNRHSLAESLRTSEQGGDSGGPPFDWHIAVDIGDMSGGQDLPDDDEGQEVVQQFAALAQHQREDIYSICGNHDRSGLTEQLAWWWQKWIDPLGEHAVYSGVDSAKRPYPIEGTWERYSS